MVRQDIKGEELTEGFYLDINTWLIYYFEGKYEPKGNVIAKIDKDCTAFCVKDQTSNWARIKNPLIFSTNIKENEIFLEKLNKLENSVKSQTSPK